MRKTTLTVTEGIDLSGKTALITGSSSGIGRECARVLALRGARVLMANRNEQKTAAVVNVFADTIGSEAAQRCEFRHCDTASMKTVRTIVDTIVHNREKIDFLFLNAGVFGVPYRLTDDGFENTMATNYIGHFLMTHALAMGQAFSPNARIIGTMTSGIYYNPFSKMDLATLINASANEKNFKRANASPNSKVMLLYLIREFARRVAETHLAGISALGADPGGTVTDNVNQGGALVRTLIKIAQPFLMHSVEVGTAVLLWTATNPALSESGGRVYDYKLNETKLTGKCINAKSAELCWDTTEKVLGLQKLIA